MKNEAVSMSPTYNTATASAMAPTCASCGSCNSFCRAVSLVPGWTPSRAIRSVALGREQEVIDSKWPWVCTMCGRCQRMCPQCIDLLEIVRSCRGMRERNDVPGSLHDGVLVNLEKGNNLGIPKTDMLQLLAEMSLEMEEDDAQPCPGFYVPVDKQEANLLVTINSKEPFGEPDDMKLWWKIFYAAEEDWTVSSINWDGVMWGFFTGDDETLKIQVGRILENARRLNVKTIMYPE